MDNPSAFPRPATILPGGEVKDWGEEGMTLRDYFAAHVITGMLSELGIGNKQLIGHTDAFTKAAVKVAAENAYTVADAMLFARTHQGGPA